MAAQLAIEFEGAFLGKEDPGALEFNSLARAGDGLGQPMRPSDIEVTSSVPPAISVGAFSFRRGASTATVCLLSKAARKRWKSRVRCSVLTRGRR